MEACKAHRLKGCLKLRGASAQDLENPIVKLSLLAFHLLGQQVRVLAEPEKSLDCVAPG